MTNANRTSAEFFRKKSESLWVAALATACRRQPARSILFACGLLMESIGPRDAPVTFVGAGQTLIAFGSASRRSGTWTRNGAPARNLLADFTNLNTMLVGSTALGRDKRLLVLETEFSMPLVNAKRTGNNLFRVVREMWDGKKVIRTLVSHSPLRATGAHVSIVGHIICDELIREIDINALMNGVVNRFLLAVIGRSKELPSTKTPREIWARNSAPWSTSCAMSVVLA